MNTNNPTIALMYDFDKTLCTKDMQEYTFIPHVGMNPGDFWAEADKLAIDKKTDRILAYMKVMLDTAHAAKKPIRRSDFIAHGQNLEFFPGVESWFERMGQIGTDTCVTVEHYIISSGLREIIEGSAIYKHFKEVFACEFLYDENDVACWPKNCVNYTTKTQFLFRINKGILDISNDYDLNRFTPEGNRPVPFRNMIYIGDGLTDVPCMKLVKEYGGHSIAVYPNGGKDKAGELLTADRVDFIATADYSAGSELDTIIIDMIQSMAINASLIRRSKEQLFYL